MNKSAWFEINSIKYKHYLRFFHYYITKQIHLPLQYCFCSTGLIRVPTAPRLVRDPDKLFAEPNGLLRFNAEFNSGSDPRILNALICSGRLVVASPCISFFVQHCVHRTDRLWFKNVQFGHDHLFLGDSCFVDGPHAVKFVCDKLRLDDSKVSFEGTCCDGLNLLKK